MIEKNGNRRCIVRVWIMILSMLAAGLAGCLNLSEEPGPPFALECSGDKGHHILAPQQIAEGGEVTVLARVKINDAWGRHAILFTGAGWDRKGIKFLIQDGKLRFQLGDGSAEAYAREGAVAAGEWTLVGGMWKDGRIYHIVNGVIIEAAEWPGGHYPNPDFDVHIGGPILDPDGSVWSNMDGKIADVRIYDRALSEEEIHDMMRGPSIAGGEGLIGCWPLNEGAGYIAHDHSGNGNHGKITGASWVLDGAKLLAEPHDAVLQVLARIIFNDQPDSLRRQAVRMLEDLEVDPAPVAGVLRNIMTEPGVPPAVRLEAALVVDGAEANLEAEIDGWRDLFNQSLLRIIKDREVGAQLRSLAVDIYSRTGETGRMAPVLTDILEDTEEIDQVRLKILDVMLDKPSVAGSAAFAVMVEGFLRDAQDSAAIRLAALDALAATAPALLDDRMEEIALVVAEILSDKSLPADNYMQAATFLWRAPRQLRHKVMSAVDEVAPGRPGLRAGLIGPDEAESADVLPPPLSPDSWHVLEGNILHEDNAWGLRFKPRGVFQMPGGVGVLYNSRPPANFNVPQGFASGQTGSLAFSRNLSDWHDYPHNPVMYKLADWQGTQRAMPRSLLYDEKGKQWVSYFCDHTGDYPGERAVGTATSKDLVNWHPGDRPTVTVEDFGRSSGRVYAEWAIYYEERYYVQVNGRVMVSDAPHGPFERVEVQGGFVPRTRPVYAAGKWYTVFTIGSWGSQTGFGLAWSENLLGPYEQNPQNPIIKLDIMARSRPQLFCYNGTWAILFAMGPFPGPMRIAVAGEGPDGKRGSWALE